MQNYRETGEPYVNQFRDGVEQVDTLVERLHAEGKLPERFPQEQSVRSGILIVPEPVVLREGFTVKEKRVIEDKGGLIYLPTVLTMDAQREAQRAKHKPSFWFVTPADERLVAAPSRQVEVAIFPVPADSFVPGSFRRNLATQERMAAEDARRLGLPNVTQVISDKASTLTNVVFQHLDRTGKWLLGRKHAKAQGLDWVYASTKNPTNSSGSTVTIVGYVESDSGVDVAGWFHDIGHGHIGALRMAVPVVESK